MEKDDQNENIEKFKGNLRIPMRNKTTRFREKSSIAKKK